MKTTWNIFMVAVWVLGIALGLYLGKDGGTTAEAICWSAPAGWAAGTAIAELIEAWRNRQLRRASERLFPMSSR